MEEKEILDKLKDIIKNQLGSVVDSISMETTLAEDLQADSLDKVEMIMSAEEEFNISIDDDAAVDFVTVGDVVKYIKAKL